MRANNLQLEVTVTVILTFAVTDCGGSGAGNASSSATGGRGTVTLGGMNNAQGIGGAHSGGTLARDGDSGLGGTRTDRVTGPTGGVTVELSSSRNQAAGGTTGSKLQRTTGVVAAGGLGVGAMSYGGSGGITSRGGNATDGGVTSTSRASSGEATAAGAPASGGIAPSGGTGNRATPASGGTTIGGTITAGMAATAGVGDVGAIQTCPVGQIQPVAGNRRLSLSHGGKSRSYILHVPVTLPSLKPLALVFDLHGAGSSGSGQQSQSGWGTTADREGFLVIYPDGIDGYWNVDDKCCGTAGSQKVDDVGFLKAIIAALKQEICIDAKRIYFTGFSNGGGLTHRMGCDAADLVAAIAPVATDLRTQPCNAARPISMMEIRGTGDTLEPYEGGLVGPAGGQYLAVGAKASLKLWAELNHCSGTPATFEKYCEGYSECQDAVETDLCSLPGVDHDAYHNGLNFSIPDTAWRMFQRQPRR